MILLPVLLIGGCSWLESWFDGDGVQPTEVVSDPADEDLVNAVRSHLRGKTYEEKQKRTEPVTRTCTQFDVDTDPYMPHNEELATCPYVGATYTDYVWVTEAVNRSCDVPAPGAMWTVIPQGDDRWRVSHGGSSWELTKIEGGGVAGGEGVEVAGFLFRIVANQDC